MSKESQKQQMAELLRNNQELSLLLFDENQKMYDYEREALLNIANFLEEKATNLLPGAEIKDVILCGGITSHIYNENTDIDLAILLDIDEKYISKEDFRLFLKKVNKGLNMSGYLFKILNRNVDYGFMNYLHPGSGVFSLKDNKWISKPVYREFSYSIDEFFEAYYQYSKDIHERIKSFSKINEQLLTIEGSKNLENYLFSLREEALNAKVKSPEQEYCMEYNFYRCAKMFGVIQHFSQLVNESIKFAVNNPWEEENGGSK